MSLDWKKHATLLVSLLAASLLHALLILGISFERPKTKEIEKTLDIVLVVSPPPPKPPVSAELLAPELQQSSAEAAKEAVPSPAPNVMPEKIEPKPAPPAPRRVKQQPLRPPPKPMEEDAPEPVPEEKPAAEEERPVPDEKPVAEETPAPEEEPPVIESKPKPVLRQAKSEKKVLADGNKKDSLVSENEPHRLSAGLLSQQIAEVTMEFNKTREDKAKQQRMVYINAVNAHKYNAAAYESAWQEKVERIGNLNYPEEARRGNLSGSLLLAVAVNKDGSIYSIQVRQSSGEPVLDEAAQQIVRMAAPFAAFPEELQEEADILVIARTWRFSADNRVETGQ